ncbi:MAG: S-layer homology domain-containing protein [Monoglobus pectinilyticus]
MVELGLITGMEDGSFKPLDNLTRAEAATIIERIMNLG